MNPDPYNAPRTGETFLATPTAPVARPVESTDRWLRPLTFPAGHAERHAPRLRSTYVRVAR